MVVIHLCEIVCVRAQLCCKYKPCHFISTIFLRRDTEMTCGNSCGASFIVDLAIFTTSLADNVNSFHSKPRVICGNGFDASKLAHLTLQSWLQKSPPPWRFQLWCHLSCKDQIPPHDKIISEAFTWSIIILPIPILFGTPRSAERSIGFLSQKVYLIMPLGKKKSPVRRTAQVDNVIDVDIFQATDGILCKKKAKDARLCQTETRSERLIFFALFGGFFGG